MFTSFFARNRELALVVLMLMILTVLFAPIPTAVLDLALIMNFGLSLAILLLTFYVAKPVDFSTFPSLLLIATLFRLAINIASTRLILTGGDAGEVIAAIGTFSISGNFVVGLVVFFILVIVQFIVVTSGAQRVSEVAARFTLDSMPGQQMSIDADLNMGLITQEEAVKRRRTLEKEASFYGSMDGASKFVKGDAIAGIIIVFINIIAGCIIGVVSMDMSWGEAVQTFSLLTVGDGIATQIPALVIAVATGIIVTRSSSDRDLSTEVFAQLLSAPKALLAVCGILTAMLMLPGMPKWPLIVIGGLAAILIFNWQRLVPSESSLAPKIDPPDSVSVGAEKFPAIAVHFGPAISDAWKDLNVVILERIENLRDAQERDLGLAFPAVSLRDGTGLGTYEYEIRLLGTRYAQGEVRPDQILALRTDADAVQKTLGGMPGIDPAFGLAGEWISKPNDGKLVNLPVGWTEVDALTVFITHLGEVLRAEAPVLLTRAATVRLLERVRGDQPGLVEELIPTLMAVSDVQKVLQLLVSEGVKVSNIELIVEHLVDLARTEKDAANLVEALRQRLALSICNALRGRNKDLAVLTLEPRLENQIGMSLAQTGRREGLPFDARLAETLLRRLSEESAKMSQAGRAPVLLCSSELRRPIRAVMKRAAPKLAIISVAEIPQNIELTAFGVVHADPEQRQSPIQSTQTTAQAASGQGSPTPTPFSGEAFA
jgi:flagellar biosynthesis protein FlhA